MSTQNYRQALNEKMNETVCYSDTIWSASRPESNLGNWAADAVVWQSSQLQQTQETIIGIMNKGGLRSVLPQGRIEVRNFFELMPFENNLSLVRISKDSFLSLLQYLQKKGGEPIAGFKFDNKNPQNAKLDVNGKVIAQLKEIPWIATSDYLANGGDHMSFFLAPVERIDFRVSIRESLISYAKFQDTLRITHLNRWHE